MGRVYACQLRPHQEAQIRVSVGSISRYYISIGCVTHRRSQTSVSFRNESQRSAGTLFFESNCIIGAADNNVK
jgi:hypothetical protein